MFTYVAADVVAKKLGALAPDCTTEDARKAIAGATAEQIITAINEAGMIPEGYRANAILLALGARYAEKAAKRAERSAE